ncbi:MAG: hypothetical protein R3C44_07985 [Chloroflexota bacterium]
MDLLRDRGFHVNLDLMYGLAGQSLDSWAATLRDAVSLAPDSLSTFLFVDRGTVTYEKVRKGAIVLPDHRHLQTQHLMAQLFLDRQGYYELPNDFHARNVEIPPSSGRAFAIVGRYVAGGAGAYGHYSDTNSPMYLIWRSMSNALLPENHLFGEGTC